MDKMFKRFVDVGVFEMEIYSKSDTGKTYFWLSMPSGYPDRVESDVCYEVNSFADVAKRLEEFAADYLKDDEEE